MENTMHRASHDDCHNYNVIILSDAIKAVVAEVEGQA